MADKNKSIIKEALTDYNEIMEAADANAKKKLAEEFPDKFNNLLKEEINKNKKSVKESYKKLDDKEAEKSEETESNKESVMKSKQEETKKVVETAGEGKPFGEKPKSTNVEKTVVETAGEGKPFGEKPKSSNVEKTVVETAGEGKPFGEKPKKGDVEKVAEAATVEEDVKITDTVGDGKPFTEKAKKVQKVEEAVGSSKPFDKKAKKLQKESVEEFDITELDTSSAGTALENADGEDDVLTMEQIEEEIASMEGLGEELEGTPNVEKGNNKGVAFNELVSMRDKLDEMINSMSEMHAPGKETFGSSGQISALHNDGPTKKLVDEGGLEEMHGGDFNTNTINKMHQGDYDSKLIDEEEPITDKDIEAVLKKQSAGEQPVEEAHGMAYSSRHHMPGRQLPQNKEYLSKGEQDQAPEYTLSESQKRIGGLINENKTLTKKLNEVKKYKTSVSTLLEQYKTALEKYRNQLKEMAVFNTNLAHVNNLLVNESLALTQDDKIKIINEFKKVDTIAESQKRYKNFLTEMKGSKKTLTESIEAKASVSVQPSSKQKLDEVIEKTAYADDKHIQKMRKLIETIEKRDKKIIS